MDKDEAKEIGSRKRLSRLILGARGKTPKERISPTMQRSTEDLEKWAGKLAAGQKILVDLI